MKFKFIAVFSIIILCFVSSFAQERNIEIEISMEENVIEKNAKNIPVKVKITNKAEKELKTQGLGNIIFNFSKCLTSETCKFSGDIYAAYLDLPKATLRENQSYEFDVNLADLNWKEATDGIGIPYENETEKSPNNLNDVSKKNIYFYTEIHLLPNKKKSNNSFFSTYHLFRSNTITVVRE